MKIFYSPNNQNSTPVKLVQTSNITKGKRN